MSLVSCAKNSKLTHNSCDTLPLSAYKDRPVLRNKFQGGYKPVTYGLTYRLREKMAPIWGQLVPLYGGIDPPPLLGTVMPPEGMSPFLKLKLQTRRKALPSELRPFQVTAVASYQLFRAFFLIIAVAVSWSNQAVGLAAHPILRMIIFLITRRIPSPHASQLSSATEIIAGIGVYYAATGFGLLDMNNWVRRATIAVSGFAMLRLLFMFMTLRAFGLSTPVLVQCILAVDFFLDILVVGSLVSARFGAAV
jgi:hypothetical protein